MRRSKAMMACAASMLAMVFSVQQGDYGPLVVYKLQVPKATAPSRPATAAPVLPTTVIIEDSAPVSGSVSGPVSAAPRVQRVGPLEPTILGTVVMPAKRLPPAPLPTPARFPTPAGKTFGGVPLQVPASVPDSARVYRIVEDFDGSPPMINEETGDTLTLQDVNEAVVWRRDTARKLRQVPIAPRF